VRLKLCERRRQAVPSDINESECCGLGFEKLLLGFLSMVSQQQLLGMLRGRTGFFQVLSISA
jgi:hypothetical protein